MEEIVQISFSERHWKSIHLLLLHSGGDFGPVFLGWVIFVKLDIKPTCYCKSLFVNHDNVKSLLMFPWKQKIAETGILCEIKELLFIPPILHRFWCDFFSLIGIFKAVFHSHFSSFLYKNHWNIVNENFDCQKNSWNHLIV